jgi:hypothetical protein
MLYIHEMEGKFKVFFFFFSNNKFWGGREKKETWKRTGWYIYKYCML